jgi:hypothetical protein
MMSTIRQSSCCECILKHGTRGGTVTENRHFCYHLSIRMLALMKWLKISTTISRCRRESTVSTGFFVTVSWHVICRGTLYSVVKALCYKPEGREFETRWIHQIIPTALCPGVYSASNRNEYQKQKNPVSGSRAWPVRKRLTTLPPSVSRLSRQCGVLNISQRHRSAQPVTEVALLLLFTLYAVWGIYWYFFPIFMRTLWRNP